MMTVEQPWTLTLRQYEQAVMDDYMERSGGQAVSKAEYRRCYPKDCRRSEWIREIEVAAQRGEIIPTRVLDVLFNFNEWVGWAMPREMPEYCDAPRCWARVETWCPLCEKFLCVPHDSRHECLGNRDDQDDRSWELTQDLTTLPF